MNARINWHFTKDEAKLRLKDFIRLLMRHDNNLIKSLLQNSKFIICQSSNIINN